ncbi:MAG: polysaccharide deacetylase family protein [Candidatus Peribacteraceae bacterium]|nr:polysaccharide deacetylase family protein [Candidatus Peribacteraceae bacterium]
MIFTTSWDDGYASDIRLGALLDQHGMRGTFYVCPAAQHDEHMLTKEEIRTLSATHEIGAHTLNHPRLAHIPRDEARREIADSKRWVEDRTKKPCNMFCYPKGDVDPAVVSLVKESGFTGARTTERYAFSGTSPFLLPTSLHIYPFPVRRKFTHWWHMLDPFGQLRTSWSQLRTLRIPLLALRSFRSLAETLFLEALENDSPFFHLWGHSWELTHYNLWKDLEHFLVLVASHRQHLRMRTNGELVEDLFPLKT